MLTHGQASRTTAADPGCCITRSITAAPASAQANASEANRHMILTLHEIESTALRIAPDDWTVAVTDEGEDVSFEFRRPDGVMLTRRIPFLHLTDGYSPIGLVQYRVRRWVRELKEAHAHTSA